MEIQIPAALVTWREKAAEYPGSIFGDKHSLGMKVEVWIDLSSHVALCRPDCSWLHRLSHAIAGFSFVFRAAKAVISHIILSSFRLVVHRYHLHL